MILYIVTKNNRRNKIRKIRNRGILNKFLRGVNIIKSKPERLLIKKRGYRKILVQKLFI